ncbi:hypothetical protein [Rhizobium leguminosarum]|uniref:hypothetical protein n=1 Tax=Rhizobium leguminosarum TaxID=384 RepID=UPI001C942894|nr:hypothetical protein [Rhizobium leguminosarum]
MIRSSRETDLKHDIAKLKDEASQKTKADVIRAVDADFGMQAASGRAECDLHRHHYNDQGIV